MEFSLEERLADIARGQPASQPVAILKEPAKKGGNSAGNLTVERKTWAGRRSPYRPPAVCETRMADAGPHAVRRPGRFPPALPCTLTKAARIFHTYSEEAKCSRTTDRQAGNLNPPHRRRLQAVPSMEPHVSSRAAVDARRRSSLPAPRHRCHSQQARAGSSQQ